MLTKLNLNGLFVALPWAGDSSNVYLIFLLIDWCVNSMLGYVYEAIIDLLSPLSISEQLNYIVTKTTI